MSIYKHVKNLKSKSENTRRQVLALSLAVSMAIVVLIWIGGINYKANAKVQVANANNEAKPFALFGNTLKTTYGNISASVGNISSTIKGQEAKSQKENLSEENGKVIDLVPVEYTE